MAIESKSVRYDVELDRLYTGEQMHKTVEEAAKALNIYISHIGSFSRKKYPNSIHWHFKQKPGEKGCLDATFWEEGNQFWIVARNYDPECVKQKARAMQRYMNKMQQNPVQ